MRILAIETSCDETAMALVNATGGLSSPKFKIEKNVVSSQIAIHRPFGGVVPNLAKREHIKNLPIVLSEIFGDTRENIIAKNFKKVDMISVTVGPGLEPALWTGIEFAKELYKETKKKNKKLLLRGVNHMEGHLYSFLLQQKTVTQKSKPKTKNMFPSVALVVSGGHTILLLLESLTKWKKLGETRDDAVGEAFDKVARMLNLPYPGGPEVEKLAKSGDGEVIDFPRPMIHAKNYDFSFSGLKTAVLYYMKKNKNLGNNGFADIAASFQKSAIDVLVKKTIKAAGEFGAKSVILCGGVAGNRALREVLGDECKNEKLEFFVPPFEYNTDNAAMIVAAAYINFLRKKTYAVKARAGLGM